MSAQFDVLNVLRRAEGLEVAPEFLPYSGVEIVTGKQDEQGNDIIYTAGDSSGRVLTINNPWGTQTQANNIINRIRGFSYQPYTAEGALVDPCAEIGDGVSVNDVYSGVYKMTRDYNALMPAEIAAPQSEEIDHEYPYESMGDREMTRRFTEMESELSIASSEISAKVSKKSPEGQTSFSWNLTDSAWVVKSGNNTIFKVDSSGAQVAGKITASSGQIGGFTIGASAIYKDTTRLTSGTKGVYVGTDGIRINGSDSAYFKADKNGNIEAYKLKLTGTLTIGSSTIDANALRNGANSGRAYGTATGSANPSSYPDYFTTKYLYTKYGITAEGTTTIKGALYVQGGANGQYLCKWKTIIVNGVSYVALCQAP